MESTQISDIQLFSLLKDKLGEAGTDQLITFVKNKTKDNTMIQTNHLATKADLERMQSKLILWSFVFWTIQFATVIALLKL